MKTLIQVQEEALAKLDVSRSSPRRYAKLGISVARWYREELTGMGADIGYVHATWRDVLDMNELRLVCDESETA